jgi:hypothetical protein
MSYVLVPVHLCYPRWPTPGHVRSSHPTGWCTAPRTEPISAGAVYASEAGLLALVDAQDGEPISPAIPAPPIVDSRDARVWTAVAAALGDAGAGAGAYA